jgi:hypothetical protein
VSSAARCPLLLLLLLLLQDKVGHHSSALFVQWVPYQLSGTTWEQQEEKYVQHLLQIVDDFAPGVKQAVARGGSRVAGGGGEGGVRAAWHKTRRAGGGLCL